MISNMITLSTAHITEETAILLNDDRTVGKWGVVAYAKSVYGWFIPLVFGELTNVPADLLGCIKYALGHNCSCLCLDQAGDIVDDLPIYDW